MASQLTAGRDGPVDLEIILPVFNEETVLDALFGRLDLVFDSQARLDHQLSSVRFLIIDDGSSDNTAARIAQLIREGLPARLIRLSRNFGHQAALSAGLDHAKADLVAIMDADLQDPPEIILEMVQAWRGGADVAFGVRENRKEGIIKKFAYAAFYRVYAFLAEVDVPLDSGDFSLLDRKVVEAMKQLPERLRFPRGLRTWVGFNHVAIPYERLARQEGESKYDWRSLYHLATDGIAAMSIRPLRIVQFSTFFSSLFTLILGTGLAVRVSMGSNLDPEVYWSLIVCLAVLATSSVNLACLYIFSAYIGRTYLEIKGRPTFVVMETVPAEKDPSE
ncbi:MAG: glycosyltransferase family 2 protein [Candidatus Binatia bacterium]|nr:glycosyltransferase family 2 protein [Candidatus Binatia bacterium]MDG2010929.1 glycosyltransferase family 2 protein [Candidatus Binatia bacterium]HAC80043.1 glycosyltransferase [Deltaproteobacteria bacterium]